MGFVPMAPHDGLDRIAGASLRLANQFALVGWVIEKCVRKDPANRYENMTALIADLDALAEGREPSAGRQSLPGDAYELGIAEACAKFLDPPEYDRCLTQRRPNE